MLGILKLIFGLGFLAMAFGFGYLWGSQKNYSIQETLNSMRSEFTSKMASLEEGISRVRIRMELMNARDHLIAAQTAYQNRNFGETQKELDQARQVILKVAETADPEQKKELAALAAAVQEIQKQVRKPVPPKKLGVQETIRALDRFLS